jgi:hypothetical protein
MVLLETHDLHSAVHFVQVLRCSQRRMSAVIRQLSFQEGDRLNSHGPFHST